MVTCKKIKNDLLFNKVFIGGSAYLNIYLYVYLYQAEANLFDFSL